MKKIFSVLIFMFALFLPLCACSKKSEKKYYISFYSDENLVQTIETNGHKTISFPNNPTKLHYNFIGWNLDNKNWTQPVTENYFKTNSVNQNINIYAQFEYKFNDLENFEYNIQYDDTCIITAIKDNSVTEIVLPSYVVGINEGVFESCTALQKLETPFVGTSLNDGGKLSQLFNNNIPASLEEVVVTGNSKIRQQAFYNCSNIKKITFTGSISQIESNAFSGCTSLTKLNLPSNLTTTAMSAFSGCTALEQITLPNSLQTLGSFAFSGCTALQRISLPQNLQTISTYCFNDCSSLLQITIPASVTQIGSSAFSGCTALQSATINSSAPISTAMFSGCTSLSLVTFAQEISSIESSAFSGCTSLKQITLPNNLLTLGSTAFSDCSALESITIPESLTQIGDSVFKNCSSLQSFVFNATNCERENTTIISKEANYMFYGCNNLQSLTIGKNVCAIPDYMFGYTKITAIDFETNNNLCAISNIENYAFYKCTELQQLNIPNSSTPQGCIGQYAFRECSALESVSLFNNLETINESAFSKCEALEQITFPNTLKSIGSNAFYDCGELTEIEIPSGLTTMGSGAFCECNKLQKITLPFVGSGNNNENPNRQTVFGFLFGTTYNNCLFDPSKNQPIPSTLTTVIINGSSVKANAFYRCPNITTITLQNSVQQIGTSAFSNCINLSNITISNNLTTLGASAFYSCTALQNISFSENLTYIGQNAFKNCSALQTISIENAGEWKVYYEMYEDDYELENLSAKSSSELATFFTTEVIGEDGSIGKTLSKIIDQE